jgi:hypothetical protein
VTLLFNQQRLQDLVGFISELSGKQIFGSINYLLRRCSKELNQLFEKVGLVEKSFKGSGLSNGILAQNQFG